MFDNVLKLEYIEDMSKREKLIAKILSGEQDGNVTFDELMGCLSRLGFAIRNTGGSHFVASRPQEPPLTLQPRKDGKAKPYQLAQTREHFKTYGLEK